MNENQWAGSGPCARNIIVSGDTTALAELRSRVAAARFGDVPVDVESIAREIVVRWTDVCRKCGATAIWYTAAGDPREEAAPIDRGRIVCLRCLPTTSPRFPHS